MEPDAVLPSSAEERQATATNASASAAPLSDEEMSSYFGSQALQDLGMDMREPLDSQVDRQMAAGSSAVEQQSLERELEDIANFSTDGLREFQWDSKDLDGLLRDPYESATPGAGLSQDLDMLVPLQAPSPADVEMQDPQVTAAALPTSQTQQRSSSGFDALAAFRQLQTDTLLQPQDMQEANRASAVRTGTSDGSGSGLGNLSPACQQHFGVPVADQQGYLGKQVSMPAVGSGTNISVGAAQQMAQQQHLQQQVLLQQQQQQLAAHAGMAGGGLMMAGLPPIPSQALQNSSQAMRMFGAGVSGQMAQQLQHPGAAALQRCFSGSLAQTSYPPAYSQHGLLSPAELKQYKQSYQALAAQANAAEAASYAAAAQAGLMPTSSFQIPPGFGQLPLPGSNAMGAWGSGSSSMGGSMQSYYQSPGSGASGGSGTYFMPSQPSSTLPSSGNTAQGSANPDTSASGGESLAQEPAPASDQTVVQELKSLIGQLDSETKATLKDSLYRISRNVGPPKSAGASPRISGRGGSSSGSSGSKLDLAANDAEASTQQVDRMVASLLLDGGPTGKLEKVMAAAKGGATGASLRAHHTRTSEKKSSRRGAAK